MKQHIIGKRGEKEKNPEKVGKKLKQALVNNINDKTKGGKL